MISLLRGARGGAVLSLLSLVALRAVAQPGLDNPVPVGGFLNGVLPSTTPGTATGWTTENAFPNLSWTDPLWLTPYPGTNDLVMVEKTGRIYRFDNRSDVTMGEMQLILDWSQWTETSEDQGFYSIAFHPEFRQAGSPNRGYVYVCYNHRYQAGVNNDNQTYWRVTRFTMPDGAGGVPDSNSVIDPASETILVSQFDPNLWHNGGPLFFDSEGFLYAASGDGGGGGDQFGYSQRIDYGFFGGVYRMDVDMDPARSHPIRRQPQDTNRPGGWPASFTANYFIPNSNPFVEGSAPYTGPSSVLEEFYAVGLRSPHTMHYDPVSGQVWVGDVGQGSREEMSLFQLDPASPVASGEGPNFQWAYREGNVGGPRAAPGTITGIESVPIHDYGRGEGNCIIGGFLYQGGVHAATLGGKVLFGDHGRGRIWTLDHTPGQAPVIEEIIGGFHTGAKAGLGNICQDQNGEVYLMDLNGTDNPGGIVQKLVSAGVSGEPPAWLSQTGAFTDTANLVPDPAMLPYTVGNQLYSDNSLKQRWIMVPNNGSHNSAGEQIVFSEEGNWVFPEGTVLVKHFELPTDENNPSVTTRLETRIIACVAGGERYGVTYRWLPDQSDAYLLTTGETGTYTITEAGGGTRQQTWQFPSRGDCLLCHNTYSGQALGVRTHQLNGDLLYTATGRTANQLETWNSLGMFDASLSEAQLAAFIESRPIDDLTAPLEHRVRSYLDSNCAHCHRPGAPGGTFDARLGTPLASQNIVNAPLERDFDLGPDDAIVKPMDVPMSAIHFRMNHANPDPNAMPPLAKNEIDAFSTQEVANWINGLVDAQFQLTGGTTARYVKFIADSEVNGNPWASISELNVLDGSGVVIPQNTITISEVDSEETAGEDGRAVNVLDGNPATHWHTIWTTPDPDAPHPHWVTLDLGSVKPVGGFKYLPRQNGANGRVANWRLEVSTDGLDFTQVASGVFPNGTAEETYDSLTGSRAARTMLGGPSGTVGGDFEVTLVLDYDLTDVDAGDFNVTGGSVVGLRGSGHYYVATVRPTAASVDVEFPQDVLAGPGGSGNLASNTISVGFVDTQPPLPVFTNVPPGGKVGGPFSLGLDFGEDVTGLDASDIVVTNGTLDTLSGSGAVYSLAITPGVEGPVTVEVVAGAVIDTVGNAMAVSVSITLDYVTTVLALEAEEGTLFGGMTVVNDGAASNGQYVWLPDGGYPNNWQNFNPANRAEYNFVVPHSGFWTLHGLVQSDNSSSDSFWVEIDGNQGAGTVYLWDTAPVGPATFSWDIMNDRGGADPVVLNLSAGPHTVTIYGRDDGTRLDRLELVSERPLPTLAGPLGPVTGLFQVSVGFSESVTGLTISDFVVTGGAIVGFSGTGSAYNLTVDPGAPTVTVSLPADVVTDVDTNGNFPSNTVTVSYLGLYGQWASGYGLSGPAADHAANNDGDPWNNLVEFLFNLDPTVEDWGIYDPAAVVGIGGPAGLPLLSIETLPGGEQNLRVVFIRRKAAAAEGYDYVAQFSNDLTDLLPDGWTDFAGSETVESIDADWEKVTVEDTATSATHPERFGRMKVRFNGP